MVRNANVHALVLPESSFLVIAPEGPNLADCGASSFLIAFAASSTPRLPRLGHCSDALTPHAAGACLSCGKSGVVKTEEKRGRGELCGKLGRVHELLRAHLAERYTMRKRGKEGQRERKVQCDTVTRMVNCCLKVQSSQCGKREVTSISLFYSVQYSNTWPRYLTCSSNTAPPPKHLARSAAMSARMPIPAPGDDTGSACK